MKQMTQIYLLDLLHKPIIYPAPGGVLAAEDGDESTYEGDLFCTLYHSLQK